MKKILTENAGISKIENKQQRKINKTKSWFFERSMKLIKTLAKQIKNKKENTNYNIRKKQKIWTAFCIY